MEQTNETKTNNETIPEENVQINWLEDEAQQLHENRIGTEERLEGLILEEGKLTEFTILIGDEPFKRWIDEENKVTKVIIPVEKDGKKFSFWLNLKNPTYHEIIKQLKIGKRKFRILRTGKMKQTRYQLIE